MDAAGGFQELPGSVGQGRRIGMLIRFLRRCGTAVLALSLLGSVLPAGADPLDGPAVQFDYREVNLGVMPQKAGRDTVFTFRNSGNQDLRILDVKTSCGCTAALASESIIPPGGRGTIEVHFDSKRFKGTVAKTVKVMTNDPGEPESKLRVLATVKPLLNVDPERIDFGLVQLGENPARRIRIASEKGKNLQINEVDFSRELFDSELSSVAHPDSEVYVLELRVADSPPLGAFRQEVRITTSLPDLKPVIVPVRGEVIHHFRVRPAMLNLGSFRAGDAPRQVLSVTRIGQSRYEVESVECGHPKIRLQLEYDESDESYRISTMVEPGIEPGRIDSRIVVHTNDPDQPRLMIPLLGYVKPTT
ncbi:MAG: DUF1573 domain-containing protein [Candidatus Eisenbacteria bacterium]|nr:DUF1573 domain-containing protein [Candidatus Eisenbacteria bacterium]